MAFWNIHDLSISEFRLTPFVLPTDSRSLKRLSPGSISTDDPNIDLYIDSHQCEYL